MGVDRWGPRKSLETQSPCPGKRASEGERREAMRNAQGFIKAKGLRPGTNVTRWSRDS